MSSNIEKIIVPQDKCPLETIAELGEKAKNAWIFMNEDVISYLRNTSITIPDMEYCTFNNHFRIVVVKYLFEKWAILTKVTIGQGIPEFEEHTENPENIFMIEMEK